MTKEEKIMEILKKLKKYGLKKTSILGLALLIMINSTSATELNNKVTEKETKTISFENPNNFEFYNVLKGIDLESIKNSVTKEPTNEEKIAVILERENLSKEQFDEIVATVNGEAAPGSYDDAYAVINTFYNRKTSKTWIAEMIRATGVDNGDNLYAQITLINQSEVYTNGSYKQYLGITDIPAYQAVIDFLYTLEPMHDYLCFYASYGDIPNSVQFVENGNWYYSLMPAEDKVIETKLVREK